MECPHLEDNACITTPNIKSENLPSRFVCGGEYSSYKVDECLDVCATKLLSNQSKWANQDQRPITRQCKFRHYDL